MKKQTHRHTWPGERIYKVTFNLLTLVTWEGGVGWFSTPIDFGGFFSKMVTATYDETLCKFLFYISEDTLTLWYGQKYYLWAFLLLIWAFLEPKNAN